MRAPFKNISNAEHEGEEEEPEKCSQKVVKVFKHNVGGMVKSKFLLTLLHSEWPKLSGVLVVLSAVGLNPIFKNAVQDNLCSCCYTVILELYLLFVNPSALRKVKIM